MTDSKKNQKIIDNYDYLTNAASSTDCTGLIPFLPTDEAQLESYNELYQYQSPAAVHQTCIQKTVQNSLTGKSASKRTESYYD